MLLQLLVFYAAMGAVVDFSASARPVSADKPAVFSLIPELDTQAVRDAWIRLERETLAATLSDAAKKNEPESALPPLGVIGAVEPVLLENIPVALPARVDTGASLSSIGVDGLKHFERDGKPWVSFVIKPRGTGQEHSFERRVIRSIKVKQHGREAISRPLVNMTIRLGDMTIRREFTLADRHNFTYQILLGRNLLQGLALIDVSTSNTLQ